MHNLLLHTLRSRKESLSKLLFFVHISIFVVLLLIFSHHIFSFKFPYLKNEVGV